MKQIIFLSVLTLITNILHGQEREKGEIIVRLSIGASFSNFLNSEAPHKINLLGSDVIPVAFPSPDLTTSSAYTDYETGVFKDLMFSLVPGVQVEYYIKNSLSISSGISYDSKGIDLTYTNTIRDYTTTGGILTEKFNLKICNGYLTWPLILKKYILKEKNIFVAGGLYTGYLLSSRIDYLNQKTLTEESDTVYYYSTWIGNEKDKKREYTNKIDFGLSLGTGYTREISDKLIFKTELLLNIGLVKVDSRYNNDFSVTPVPSGSNFSRVLVRSTNYYGLNSYSKNINMLFTIGLGYKFEK
jgi:Outer membrane protein beta-barrel domain